MCARIKRRGSTVVLQGAKSKMYYFFLFIQQKPVPFQRAFSMTYEPIKLSSHSSSPLTPTGGFKAPFAMVYNPLQPPSSSLLQRRHSTSSIPSHVRVSLDRLKEVAQICPSSPVEVEVPGLKVRHIQFNSPLQLYSQKNILDSLQGQISSISPTFPR